MSTKDGDMLIDIELTPDPYDLSELGPADDNEVIRDDNAKGCRLTLVRRRVHSYDLGHGLFGAIELECSLLPAHGLRFTFAQIVIKLEEPSGQRFIDIAPTSVTKAGRVQHGFEAGGKIIEIPYLGGLGAYIKTAQDMDYQYCSLRGAGGGTARAEWRMDEDARTAAGIDNVYGLFMTVNIVGRIGCSAGVSARVGRTGPSAGVRNLVMGTRIEDSWRKFEVEIPSS